MVEILRSNDLVLLSYAGALLAEAAIAARVLDGHMSIVEGSLGILPRRLVVDDADAPRARRLLADAGLGSAIG
jgi:hypothetical protein